MNEEQNLNRNNDEIDLVQLFLTLWEGKWQILLGVIISGAVGIVLALLLPKSYEYKTEIVAAKTVDYNRMYVGKLMDWRPKPITFFEDAIDLFKSNELAEQALQKIMPKDLSNEAKLAWLDTQLRTNIERQIQHIGKTKLDKEKQKEDFDYFDNSITLSYQCGMPEKCKTFLNTWTDLVHDRLVKTEVNRIQQSIADTLEQLSFNEKRMQDFHNINSTYYVKVFEEAKQLAEKLGIRENQHESNVFEMGEFLKEFKATTDPELNAKNVKDNIENLGLRTPLYLYGTQTLGAIIDALNLRKQDVGFIEALAKTQYEIDEWKAVDVEPEGVKFFRVVSKASPVSVKSKRKLIVLVVVLMGFLLSVMVVLIRGAIKIRAASKLH